MSMTEHPHLRKQLFTLSASPDFRSADLSQEGLLKNLNRFASRIHDINFTCRVPPFERDAHGVVIDPMKAEMHLRDMLRLQEQTGIRVSALFNNIYVPPTLENLQLFIKGFAKHYELGVRSATIPHTLWMKWGLLQREFPELSIKNTVLRKVRNGQEFWNGAEAGFDYLNLDRLLLRDERTLREIRRAQQLFEERYGKKVLLSVLANEMCVGTCPFWDEHYQHTMTHPDGMLFNKQSDFYELPKIVGCKTESPSPLRRVLPPAFREDFDRLAQHFDVLKICGRRSHDALHMALSIIEDITEGTHEFVHYLTVESRQLSVMFHQAPPALAQTIDRWRKVIRQCRFQCWDCDLCQQLESESRELITQQQHQHQRA